MLNETQNNKLLQYLFITNTILLLFITYAISIKY